MSVHPSDTSTGNFKHSQITQSLHVKRSSDSYQKKKKKERKRKEKKKELKQRWSSTELHKKYEMFSVYLLNSCVFREGLNEEIGVEYLMCSNSAPSNYSGQKSKNNLQSLILTNM